MRTAKFVAKVKVKDPDQFGSIELDVYKHENGGMFAVDSSYLEQVARTDDDDNVMIPDPFCDIEDSFDVVTLIE